MTNYLNLDLYTTDDATPPGGGPVDPQSPLPPQLPTEINGERMNWFGRWQMTNSHDLCTVCGESTTLRIRRGCNESKQDLYAIACAWCNAFQIDRSAP